MANVIAAQIIASIVVTSSNVSTVRTLQAYIQQEEAKVTNQKEVKKAEYSNRNAIALTILILFITAINGFVFGEQVRNNMPSEDKSVVSEIR